GGRPLHRDVDEAGGRQPPVDVHEVVEGRDPQPGVALERQREIVTVGEDPLPVLARLRFVEGELREDQEEGGVRPHPRLPGEGVQTREETLRVAGVLGQELEKLVLEPPRLLAGDQRRPRFRARGRPRARVTLVPSSSSVRGASKATPTRNLPSRVRSGATRTTRPGVPSPVSSARRPCRSMRTVTG